MARSFGEYSPAVPLGVTWEESILLEDENGSPVDLTGYDVRAQLRAVVPVVAAGVPLTYPVMEITTAGYYGTAPAWPVVEAFTIADPTDGTITLRVDVDDLDAISPSNAKAKLLWSIVLVNKNTGYAIPLVTGKPVFLPATTL